jgi:Transposase DDE domain/Transposase domain (DUF772)
MFKKTNPQRELFGVDARLTDGLRARLKGSWAHTFKDEILPILMSMEEGFAMLYGGTGRPNFSVGRLLGLCLLQEFNDFSDQAALDAFGFDLRWRYALDVGEDEAYLSRRSLVEFRHRLLEKDPEMKLMREVFERVGRAAIRKLGLSVSEQRLDSTHIVSNIRTRGRVDLFQNTMALFIRSLSEEKMKKIPADIREWHEREPEGWFGLGPAERKASLEQLALYLHRLIIVFKGDKEIEGSEEYQLLGRLFNEQCEMVEKGASDSDDDSGAGKGDVGNKDVEIKVKKKTEGETLQSPFDPDASYGHKGSGYSAHITETCNNEGKPEIITDYEVHGAVRSDIAKAPGVLDRLEASGMMPERLYADGGYPSVPSAAMVVERGVDFMSPVNRGPLPDGVVGRDEFEFDKAGLVAGCPEGHEAIDHRILSANNGTGRSLHAIFDGDVCRKCGRLVQCPVRAPNHRERGCSARDTVGDFRLEITPELRLRDDMFAKQKTPEWKERYKIRSGIEATMSELKRSHGMGKLRVRRRPRVLFAVACKVTACNIKRWLKALSGCPNGLVRVLEVIYRIFRDMVHHSVQEPTTPSLAAPAA